MALGDRCLTCKHPLVSALNAEYFNGRPAEQLARTYSLGRDSVLRHFKDDHPLKVQGQGARAGAGFTVADDATPRQKLEALIATLELQASKGSIRVDLARELRMAYTDLEKLSYGQAPTEVSMKDVKGLPELIGDIAAALEPFPAARKVFVEVAQRHGFADA